MVVIVERILVRHLPFLNKLKATPHVQHRYSVEMSQQSEMAS